MATDVLSLGTKRVDIRVLDKMEVLLLIARFTVNGSTIMDRV